MAILRVKDNDGNMFEIPAIKGDKGDDGRNGADGYTPYPAENGNWSINGVDTGKPWKGEKGDSYGSGVYFGSYTGDSDFSTDRVVDLGVHADAVLIISQQFIDNTEMNGLALRGGYMRRGEKISFEAAGFTFNVAEFGEGNTILVSNSHVIANDIDCKVCLNKTGITYNYIAFVNEG